MIVARHVAGKFNTLRTYIRYLLIAIFMLIPWITYNGRPAVLLDMGARKFYFPGFVIWPQEFYYLLFLLLIAGLALFLFTALWGRLWCGWACPQTIYTDLFDEIGRLLFPANYGKRSERLWQRIIIHSLWLIVAFVITFHFIAYFVSAREMVHETLTLNMGIFVEYAWPYFLVVTSFIFYLDIAFFREHLCIYLCPYARFQSVMMDEDSIVIAYDSTRGEPRRMKRQKIVAASPAQFESDRAEGDCTACNMCTLVCPTGIDIREGLQVSCIQCTRCIDACTREMAKFNKETLINLGSSNWFHNRVKAHYLRYRTILYTVLITFFIGFMTTLMLNRVPMNLSVIRDQYVLPRIDGKVVHNYYRLNISNMKEIPTNVIVEAHIIGSSPDIESLHAISAIEAIRVAPQDLKTIPFVLQANLVNDDPKRVYKTVSVEFIIRDRDNPSNIVSKRSLFSIPGVRS